jgi:hypothetical protein
MKRKFRIHTTKYGVHFRTFYVVAESTSEVRAGLIRSGLQRDEYPASITAICNADAEDRGVVA